MSQPIPLGKLCTGNAGHVVSVAAPRWANGSGRQLESRLLEMGFIEGARIALVHEGPFGRDPIVVQVHGALIALGRREAEGVLVDLEPR